MKKIRKPESIRRSLWNSHMNRAKRAGLVADLTWKEWSATFNHFKGMCAYCLERPYWGMDHIVPVSKGGGTTRNNCLPCCQTCNISKSHRGFVAHGIPVGYFAAMAFLGLSATDPATMPGINGITPAKSAMRIDINPETYRRLCVMKMRTGASSLMEMIDRILTDALQAE